MSHGRDRRGRSGPGYACQGHNSTVCDALKPTSEHCLTSSPRTQGPPRLRPPTHFEALNQPRYCLQGDYMTSIVVAVVFLLWVVIGGIVAMIACPMLPPSEETAMTLDQTEASKMAVPHTAPALHYKGE